VNEKMRFVEMTTYSILTITMYLFGAPPVDQYEQKIQGIVEPFRFADISPEISGRIVEICVHEGKTANVGDTILKIEYTEDHLLAERARMIAKNRADFKAAQLKMEATKLEYDATKLVFDSTNAVSEEELWGKKYQYDAATAEFEQLSVQKEKELVEYQIALSRLKTHFIIAPYRCAIAAIKLREWEHCKVAEPLVSIVDASECQFVTYVPLKEAGGLSFGKKVKMEIGSATGSLIKEGMVDYKSPVVDPASDLFTVKIKFENKNGAVTPGVSGYLLIGE
jgi:RND family efflux transporter MFP subunit